MKHPDTILEDAVDAAINAAALSVQTELGVKTGDTAGMFFAGENHNELRELLKRYIELEMCEAEEADEERAAALNYLRNAPVFRVHLSRRVGPTPAISFVEATCEADARASTPADLTLISIRRATEDDIEEFLAS